MREAAALDRAREIAERWHWRSRTRELIQRGADRGANAALAAAGLASLDDVVRAAARLSADEGPIPSCIDDDFPTRAKAYRELTDAEWAAVRSVTAERHYALNWLCGYAPGNRWDATPTDT